MPEPKETVEEVLVESSDDDFEYAEVEVLRRAGGPDGGRGAPTVARRPTPSLPPAPHPRIRPHLTRSDDEGKDDDDMEDLETALRELERGGEGGEDDGPATTRGAGERDGGLRGHERVSRCEKVH